ncbi:MAG: TIGR00725 family protein [Methylocystaceae bacterium]
MLRIGVIGQSGSIPEKMYHLAEALGREIADQGCILFTGGTSGVMEAASKGAQAAGGLVVGILPGDEEAGNSYIDVPVNTGLAGDYRSLILVHTCDGLIMVGGGNGTLGELSTAGLNRKPVVIIESSGGWAERVRQIAFDGCYLDHRRDMKLEYASDAAQAVSRLLSCIAEGKSTSDLSDYDAEKDDMVSRKRGTNG